LENCVKIFQNFIKDMGQSECINLYSFVLHEEHGVWPHTKHHNLLQLFSMAHSDQCDEEHETTLQRVFSNAGLNLGGVAYG